MKESGMSEEEIDGHVTGIDFSKPVSVRSLKTGERVEQWNYRNPDGSFGQGDYYTTPGTDKYKLGIIHERKNYLTQSWEQREKRIFQATKSEKALESTTRNKVWQSNGEWIKSKGGGKQIFTKSKDVFEEVRQ